MTSFMVLDGVTSFLRFKDVTITSKRMRRSLNPGCFAPDPVRPLDVSPQRRFAPGRFAPLVVSPLVDSPQEEKQPILLTFM